MSARDAEVLLASIAQKLATKTPHCSGTTGHSWRTIRALQDLNLEQNLLKPIWPVERNAYLLPEKFAAAWANTVLSRQSPYIVEMMPPALETAGLSAAELGAAVDRLAATLRTHRGLPTYADEVVQGAFKLGNDTLRIKYIGGGEISSVYKLSCNGRSSVLKVYAGSEAVSSHGAFGEAAITREAVRQNVTNIPRLEMTNPSESGSWALYEYIPPGAKAPPGMTLTDFLEAHALKHCDLKETSLVGDYVVDVGGIGRERPCRSSPFDVP